jgi:outer membrane receptor protein involved in Fe transport
MSAASDTQRAHDATGVSGVNLKLLLLFLLFLATTVARAQQGGTVSGIVIETYNGNPLSAVIVTVRGTTLAAQTDASGRFELKNVPVGDQVLRFSKPGYASVIVTDVRVLLGQTTTVNGNLRPEFFTLDEYEVTAEEFTEQTQQILIERQQSSTMTEAIGSEQLSKLGAGDAAEALAKVTGASIADGKYAVIRGLADRYTTTSLNGNDFPSADPDRKAAQLDLFPSQFIDRMDVSKTFSPDMPGGFAGGAVNIITKSYPDQFLFSFSLGGSYNTQASLRDDYLKGDPGSTDFFAMDDGKRKLPPIAEAQDPRGTSAPLDDRLKGSFGSRQFAPVNGDSPINSGMSLALGDSVKVFGKRLGYLGGFTYKNDYNFYDNGRVLRYDNAPGTDVDKTDARAVTEYNWAAFTALSFELAEHHELKFNFMFVQSAEDEARRLVGQDDTLSTEPGVSHVEQNILHWTERNLTYFQLAGGHEFPVINNVRLDWAGALSSATQDEPDHRIFQLFAQPNDSIFDPNGPTPPQRPTRYWRDLEENNLSVRLDLTVPVASYNTKDNAFKTGVSHSKSERDFFQRGFDVRPTGGNHPFYQNGDPNSFLSETNEPFYDYFNFPASATYQGEQTIQAAYAMGDWAAFEWLRLVGGLRYETTEISIAGKDLDTGAPISPGSVERNDLLPSVSATVYIRSNLLFRAGWSQTVVRPTYREIAGVDFYDPARNRTYIGNPGLTLSDSENYDLRLEWFPREGEIIALSVFMKKLKSPIELSGVTTDNSVITYFNYDEADVMGVEGEIRKNLGHFWDALAEFTVGFNAAYIESEVALTREQRLNRAISGITDTTRPLFDQPEYVLNGDITWDHKASGTAITLSGGVVGRRLVLVGLAKPDDYEEPSPQLDFFISQKFGKHWKAKFSAKNLLDPVYEVTQTWPQAGTLPIRTYSKGMTFGLSVSYDW